MKKVELIIFDLDGTIVDSMTDIAVSTNYTLEKTGKKPLSHEIVQSHIGWGLAHLIRQCFGDCEEAELNEARSIFIDHYLKHCLDNSVLYPGVMNVLNHFSNKRMAIITNKKTPITKAILTGLGISDFFDIVVGSGDFPKGKPCPDSTNSTIEKLGLKKDDAIIVGDMNVDINTGKNAGICTCGVTYGIGSREALEETSADFIIDRLVELKNIIE